MNHTKWVLQKIRNECLWSERRPDWEYHPNMFVYSQHNLVFFVLLVLLNRSSFKSWVLYKQTEQPKLQDSLPIQTFEYFVGLLTFMLV